MDLAETWRYRSIARVLATRSIKVRYRQSVIGIGWVLLQPLLLMLVFTVFFSVLARESGSDVPYPVFFFTGLAIWQVTSKIMLEGSSSVLGNGALVGRVWFPRIYFPVAVAMSTLVDLAFLGVALAMLLAWFGIVPGTAVVAVPLLVAIAVSTALGAAFWLSAASVTLRDVAVVLPVVTQVWFFSTPVLYPVTLVPEDLLGLYYLNPMALVVTGMRWALLDMPAPPIEAWPLAMATAVTLLVSGYLFFRQREPTFADIV